MLSHILLGALVGSVSATVRTLLPRASIFAVISPPSTPTLSLSLSLFLTISPSFLSFQINAEDLYVGAYEGPATHGKSAPNMNGDYPNPINALPGFKSGKGKKVIK